MDFYFNFFLLLEYIIITWYSMFRDWSFHNIPFQTEFLCWSLIWMQWFSCLMLWRAFVRILDLDLSLSLYFNVMILFSMDSWAVNSFIRKWQSRVLILVGFNSSHIFNFYQYWFILNLNISSCNGLIYVAAIASFVRAIYSASHVLWAIGVYLLDHHTIGLLLTKTTTLDVPFEDVIFPQLYLMRQLDHLCLIWEKERCLSSTWNTVF